MLLVIYLIWYSLFAKQNPELYRKIEPYHKKIFVVLLILTVFPATWGLIGVGFAFAPFFLVAWAISKAKGKSEHIESERQYYQQYQEQKPTGKKLTPSVPKRKKIVQSFSRKYKLNLTEEQVDRIVDASYMSFGWEREIIDMEKEYSTISQWYSSETSWLRAYFHAFHVQTVSSDFEMQRQIVLDSFDNIFLGAQPENFDTVDACVMSINNRYMTAFDDTTFMIAYRFLQANGRNVKLPHVHVADANADMEDMMRKYDSMGNAPKGSGTAGTFSL